MKKQALLGLLSLFLICSTVFATPASRTINYQGRLTNSLGNPVTDGNYVITFRLYDDPNALVGSAKWSESLTNVEVKNGYFNVRLGVTTPLLSKNVDFSNQYWLGVQVGSDNEMLPRQPLNGVPFVLNYDVPIGSIIAWHKNMPPGAPTLSSQWVECNGQTLSDPESVFDGQIIPDLNNQGRFLRGGSSSGVLQADDLKAHNHAIALDAGSGGGQYPISNTLTDHTITWNSYIIGTTGGTETRPKNMTIIWIMKIK
ncbi:MAG: hypothetical protein AB1439_08430 [candidate division FCPU426 bacterium]